MANVEGLARSTCESVEHPCEGEEKDARGCDLWVSSDKIDNRSKCDANGFTKSIRVLLTQH